MSVEERSNSLSGSNFIGPRDKLLSLCTVGRNDNYEPDFLYRLTTSVNYTASKLKEIGRLNEVEILITDWGSSPPLSEVVRFSPEGASITSFIFVPPSVVLSLGNGVAEFNSHVAGNIALRRAKGQFSTASGADVFFPLSSMKTLLDILSGNIPTPFDIEQTYFLVPRFHIPFGYINRKPDINEIDRIISTHTMIFDKDSHVDSGGAAGALLASSSMWNKLAGFSYTYSNTGYGYCDYDALERFSRRHAYADTMGLGIFSYHMGHSKTSVGQEERKRVWEVKSIEVPSLSWKEGEPNDWGMAAENFEFQIARAGVCDYLKPAVRSSFLNQAALNMLTDTAINDIVLRTITTLANSCNYTLEKICPNGIHIQDLDAMYILAWWATHSPPLSFLVCPFDDLRAPATISIAGSSSTDVYAIMQQEGVVKIEEIWGRQMQALQITFAHRGYLRVVNGPIETAIERLCNSMIGKPSFDLILFYLWKLDDSWQSMLSQSWRRLAEGGAVIFCGDSQERFNAQWDEIKGIIGVPAQYVRFTDCNAGIVIRVDHDVPEGEAIITSLKLYHGRKLNCRDIYPCWVKKVITKFAHANLASLFRLVHSSGKRVLHHFKT